MKDFFRKIAAIFMVAILMLSTTSFSLFKHFCGDQLVEVSFQKVDDCCKSENDTSHNINSNLNFSKKDCCKNETTIKQLSVLDYSNSIKISKTKIVFITAFYHSFIEKNYSFYNKIYYKDFSPPDIVFNKQIQFQSFLI